MTQAQTERTAGPWILNGKTGAFRIATSEGQIVLTVSAFSKCGRHGDYYSCETHEATSNTFLSEANARFIVTACNAHDELVAALRALEPALIRDMGAGYAGVALIQAALAKLDSAQTPESGRAA